MAINYGKGKNTCNYNLGAPLNSSRVASANLVLYPTIIPGVDHLVPDNYCPSVRRSAAGNLSAAAGGGMEEVKLLPAAAAAPPSRHQTPPPNPGRAPNLR